MKKLVIIFSVAVVVAAGIVATNIVNARERIANPQIDYDGFIEIVKQTQDSREAKRLTEPQFLEAMNSEKFVMLDARSANRYALLHVKGAINLPFTEFTEGSLAEVIPSKDSNILIYCNNNFIEPPVYSNGRRITAFPEKFAASSLNLSTQASLRAYGYENVYELGPALNMLHTNLPFEGTDVTRINKAVKAQMQ